MKTSLAGKVALVAGATRGAGRGIAVQLGAAGATVCVTGRTTRSERSEMNRPETIEETAALVDEAGGHGIAVQVDHLMPDQVRALVTPALIRELIERQVDVIVITGTAGAVAAKQTTSTVPIVVAGMGDPVASGLAQTLARPGGNLTGFSVQNAEGMPGKWLELPKGGVPRVADVAVLLNSSNPLAAVYEKRFRRVSHPFASRPPLLRRGGGSTETRDGESRNV